MESIIQKAIVSQLRQQEALISDIRFKITSAKDSEYLIALHRMLAHALEGLAALNPPKDKP